MAPVIKNLEKRKIKNLLVLFIIFSLFAINEASCNENGKILAYVAGCYGCHTSNPEEPFGGGYEIKTKYGIFISPNISKDEKNGIGNWSKEQFIKAIKTGLNPDDKPYYPAFPYNWYAGMKDSDIIKIYNYIYSLPAIKKKMLIIISNFHITLGILYGFGDLQTRYLVIKIKYKIKQIIREVNIL